MTDEPRVTREKRTDQDFATSETLAAQMLQTFLMCKWSFNHVRRVIDRMKPIALTMKLKGEWNTSRDHVDVSRMGKPGTPLTVEESARLMVDCLLIWGASHNTAMEVIEKMKPLAVAHWAQTGFKNDTGFVILPGPPSPLQMTITPAKGNDDGEETA